MLRKPLLLLLLVIAIVHSSKLPLDVLKPTHKIHDTLAKILGYHVSEDEKPQELARVTKPKVDEEVNYRINQAVVPSHYTLEYKTFYLDEVNEVKKAEEKFTFSGHVDIDFTVTKDNIDEIQFHAVELAIENLKLKHGRKLFTIEGPTENKDAQYHTIKITGDKKLIKGDIYTLSMDFSGKLSDKKQGFFRAKYTNGKKEEWVAATHMEPVYARRAFPCFDEPAMKAEFDISITVDQKYKVFGNTGIKPVSPNKNVTTHTVMFKTTPKMSTYLVALAVGDFTAVKEAATNPRTSIVAHSSNKDLDKKTVQSLKDGINSLKKLEKLTGIEYSLNDKMDHIEIEHPMTGAMENWGLITYEKGDLVYDPDTISPEKRQGNGILMAHELSHQWFGNLVTPKWWNEAWLNEGFARYLSYRIYDQVQTGWEILKQFPLKVRDEAFAKDSLDTAVAMNKDVNSPDECESKFTSDEKYATYSKAASVLYMMENVVGQKVFDTGVKNYLKARQTDTVTADDLWQHIQDAADNSGVKLDKKLKEIAESWYVAGYPIVTVKFDRKTNKITLTQERFQVDKTGKIVTVKEKPKWIVPISMVTSGSKSSSVTTPTKWLDADNKLEIPVDEGTKWVLINNKQTGYYRVTYDEENWKAIAKFLAGEEDNEDDSFFNEIETFLSLRKKLTLSDETKHQLLDDAITLAQGDALSYVIPLELTKMLKTEKAFLPWKYILNSKFAKLFLNRIKMIPEFSDMKTYVSNLIETVYTTTGLETKSKDKHPIKMLRDDVALYAALTHNGRMMQDAVAIMKRIKDDKEDVKLSDRVRIATYCAAVASNGEYREFLLERYEKEASEKWAILTGLACDQDQQALTKLLDDVLDEKALKDDKKLFISLLASINPTLNFDHLVTNFDKYQSAFENDDLKEIVGLSVEYLGTDEQLNKLNNLVQNERDTSKENDNVFDAAVKVAQANVNWNKDHPEIKEWITKQVDKTPSTTELSTETESDVTEPTYETTTAGAPLSIQLSIYLIALIVSSVYFLN